MPFYEMTDNSFVELDPTTFASLGILERGDIQRLLRDHIDVLGKDLLVVDEEFGQWEDAKRRVDLLALDKDANLVVIELKRTESGGHMDLQAIRYASMVSTMQFSQLVSIHAAYLKKRGIEKDAEAEVLDFLGWSEPDEEQFAQDVRIMLVSGDFSKELTTSVMWLAQRDIDIRCIRFRPYQYGGKTFVEVQQLIPLPEIQDFAVKIKEKERAERAARSSNRDYTKFDVIVGGKSYSRLPKRTAIYHIVKYLCSNGVPPETIQSLLSWRKNLWVSVDGKVDSQEFCQKAAEAGKFDEIRYFVDDDQLIHSDGKTYAFINQWGKRTNEAITILLENFPDHGVECTESE